MEDTRGSSDLYTMRERGWPVGGAIAVVVVSTAVIGWMAFGSSRDTPADAVGTTITDTAAPTLTTHASKLTTSAVVTTTSTTPLTTSTETKGSLLIHAVGDVNLDTDVLPVFRTHGYEHAWSGLDGLFLEDDLSIINLECSPSPDGPREPKQFVFGCDPAAYPAAIVAGVDVASLGNNHSQDHGKAAMLAGREHLVEIGLNPVGAGANDAEAGAPALFDIKGWKVAVVGFGGVAPGRVGSPLRIEPGCETATLPPRWSKRSKPQTSWPTW